MRLPISLILFILLSVSLHAQTNEGLVSALQARELPSLRRAAENRDFILADYAQFEIGETYYAAGEYKAAIPEYYKVATSHPGSILLPPSYLMLGKSYFNLKNYETAINTLRFLRNKFPDSGETPEARFLIARALEQAGDWKAAYRAYEETDLFHPLSYFGKKSRLAIKTLKKKHRKKLPPFKASADSLYKKGMAYFDRDDFEMAANIFNRLAREYPKSKYVGKAWLMLGRAKNSIPDLERAANFDGSAHYYLGLAYGRRGRFDRAMASLHRLIDRFPDSGLADDAAYWIAYYEEITGDQNGALRDYYGLINSYPHSRSVPAAIWRIGRIYYWNGDFKNAATHLHMAQLYPPGEDSPRCYYFEAKALERMENRAAALEVYKKLAERFDHTYYAYRAQEKLAGQGLAFSLPSPFGVEDFTEMLGGLDAKNPEGLAAVMEIWEQTKLDSLQAESSREALLHLAKYKELMAAGLSGYAAGEARYLVNATSDAEKESAQTKLGEMLIQSGEYRTPIRFADRKVKEAVISGKPNLISKKIWQLAYPRGYWKHVAQKADRFGLDPYLVLAVIREESRFNPRAVSRSSARGLMQIMPRTGRGIAKGLDIPRYRTQKLYEPALNVEMGTYYLSNLVKNFSSNVYLALAGYNGGPNKIKRYVKSWYNGELKLVDIDEFVESIPSRETRLYVQKVMGSYFEYKRLYERKRG